MKRYGDPTSPRALALVVKARNTNAARDRMDRAHGFAVPGASIVSDAAGTTIHVDSCQSYVRNAISAIACGLDTQDWNCVAEGFCMLQDAVRPERGELG